MDFRYTTLHEVLASVGLTDDDRAPASVPMSASAAEHWTLLLRGVLAERGHLLGSAEAHAARGLATGRVLLATLLADYSQCARRPDAPLTAAEWQAFTDRMNSPGMSCARLMGLLTRVRTEIQRRETEAARGRQAA
jgi:hypothetical protein